MEDLYKSYDEKSIEEIDREVELLEKEHKKNVLIKTLIVVAVLLFIFKDFVVFRVKYSFPWVTSYSFTKINPLEDPVQKNIYNADTEQHPNIVLKKSITGKNAIKMVPMADYSISGRVLAVNHLFTFSRSDFDVAALFDIGLGWGKMSDEKILKKYFKFQSIKVYANGSRTLYTDYKYDAPFSREYFKSHISNTHVIPASSNIFSALLKLNQYDLVKMDGQLVDLFTSGGDRIRGSLSREDINDTSRGNGSCEVMYVTKVQIGNYVYE